MKKLLLTLTLLPMMAAGQEPLSRSGVLLNRIVAIVDDGVVLQTELDAQVDMITRQLREQGTQPPPRSTLEGQVLEQLIMQRIQLQRAARLQVRVSDAMLNNALSGVAARNGLTLGELPRAMESQGIDYGRYREEMRKEMIIDALRQRDVFNKINVSDREIQRFLARQESSAGDQIDYDLSHILIGLPSAPTPDDVAERQAKVNDIYRSLEAGEDFGEMAVAYSEGGAALSGGRLGWRKGAQLPLEFFDAIRDMAPGEFTQPIRNASGFHIVALNDVRGAEQILELQSHTRHILISPNEVLDERAVQQKMTDILRRVRSGEQSFEDAARLESEDTYSAARGGDLGWNGPGAFVPVFEEQVARLSPGEISDPFRSPFGWHVVQLLDRQERDTTEEVRRQRAIEAIQASKEEQETAIWLRQLRDEAFVDVRS